MTAEQNIVRVYLIASSAEARHRLLDMVEGIPGARVVGVARGTEAASELEHTRPDLLLLDEAAVAPFPANWGEPAGGVLAARERSFGTSPEPAPGGRGLRIVPGVLKPTHRRQVLGAIRALREKGMRTDSVWPSKSSSQAVATTDSARDSASVPCQSERRSSLTGRRRPELSGLRTAQRYESIIEQLACIAYLARPDEHGTLLHVSNRVESMLGFSPAEWCGDPGFRFDRLHPDDREVLRAALRRCAQGAPGYSIDYRIFGKDGALHWLHDEARLMTTENGEEPILQGVALDITERKLIQEDLQRSHAELRRLIGGLDLLRVEEQRRLAHEMHDDFGQLLAAMKMDLSTLRQYLPPNNTQLEKYFHNIAELVDAMVGSVRRIVADLPPKMLEDLGLFDALEAMLADFEKRHRFKCLLVRPELEPHLPDKLRVALFRMVQEAFNNIAKHAQATRAEAVIDCLGGQITISICDDGIGIADGALKKPGSFGLLGIHERAAALGGNAQVESAPGAGTTIRIAIPF